MNSEQRRFELIFCAGFKLVHVGLYFYKLLITDSSDYPTVIAALATKVQPLKVVIYVGWILEIALMQRSITLKAEIYPYISRDYFVMDARDTSKVANTSTYHD